MTTLQILRTLDGGRYADQLAALGPERESVAQKREAIRRYERLPKADPVEQSAAQTRLMNAVLTARRGDLPQYVAALESPAPEVRTGVLQALAVSPFSGDIVDAVRARLDDPSPQVRRQAASTLGLVGDVRDADALMDALVKPYTPEPVAAADDVEASWRERLRHTVYGRDTDPRAGAAHALGRLKSPAALPSLLQRLGDPSHTLRTAALAAVVAFDDSETIPVVEAHLAAAGRESAEDKAWRVALISALETLRGEVRRPRR